MDAEIGWSIDEEAEFRQRLGFILRGSPIIPSADSVIQRFVNDIVAAHGHPSECETDITDTWTFARLSIQYQMVCADRSVRILDIHPGGRR